MWVSGSLISSRTCRSSSVSSPFIFSSIFLSSSCDRSRTIRGSFDQALPIGCMRVFITPSCSSETTWLRRCSGAENSLSCWLRRICSSWLRFSTSSETMVIRLSSRSTDTRIDWLATDSRGASRSGGLPAGLGVGRPGAFAAAAGGSAARRAGWALAVAAPARAAAGPDAAARGRCTRGRVGRRRRGGWVLGLGARRQVVRTGGVAEDLLQLVDRLGTRHGRGRIGGRRDRLRRPRRREPARPGSRPSPKRRPAWRSARCRRLPARPRPLQRAQNFANPVQAFQDQRHARRRDHQFAVADLAEHRLARVGNGLQPRQAQEPAGSLDRVHHPEDVIEQLRRRDPVPA